MSLLLALLALLPAGVPGEAGGSGGGESQGVQVTMEVPSASETLDAVRAASPARTKKVREDRAIHLHRVSRHPKTDVDRAPTVTQLAPAPDLPAELSAPVAPRAPKLDNSFAGLENPPHGQGDVIPPDTMGTAGPDHLVSILNSDFGVFDKRTGALLDQIPLESFWASLVTPAGTPADYPFDTKVLYDQFASRFAIVTLDCTVAGHSWVMIAVSSTSNPLGTWDKWAIPSDTDNTVWADYPGFGLDAFNIYVTANMYSFNPIINKDEYQYSKIWIIPKAKLVPGSKTVSWSEFTTTSGSSLQPAHTFGTAAAEYFLYEDNFINATTLLLAKIDNVAGIPVWHPPTPVSVSPYTIPTDRNPFPNAPQAEDSRTIDTSDTRMLSAVYRNGHVWGTHHLQGPSGKVEVSWYRIDPTGNSGAGLVVAQGRIKDNTRWYYYPSIAVNANDVAAVGFSGSSTIEYAGGYYTILRPPFTSAEPVSLLKSGAASYYKTLGGAFNRWGDFSATVVDPSDDVTFWTLQEYAMTPDPVTLASRWGTWWGKFHPSDVAAPTGLAATPSTLPQVVLNWIDASGNETGFKVERRRLPGEDYLLVKTLGPNVTTFTDNSSTGLIGGFTYSYRVQAYNATGGSYSNEAFASTVAPPPPASGGGGGGCLAMAPSSGARADVSSILHAAFLFLPAAVYGWRRRLRPGKR